MSAVWNQGKSRLSSRKAEIHDIYSKIHEVVTFVNPQAKMEVSQSCFLGDEKALFEATG